MTKRESVIIVICVIVCVGLGIASVKSYNNDQWYQKAQASAAQAKSNAQASERDLARKLAVQNQENKIKAECMKTWNQLTAKEKIGKTAPNCELELLQ